MDIGTLYHEQRPRALATLIRLLGDFDLAEDALQEAFASALQHWREDALPRNPCAWLISAARHNALDRLRRERRFGEKRAQLAYLAESHAPAAEPADEPFADDLLRL